MAILSDNNCHSLVVLLIATSYYSNGSVRQGRIAAAVKINPTYSPGGGASVHPSLIHGFLGPLNLHTLNVIPVGSVVFVGLSGRDQQTDRYAYDAASSDL